MGYRRNLKKGFLIFELNKSQNTNYQNLWDEIKAELRGNFITLNVHIRKEEKMFPLRHYQKPKQTFWPTQHLVVSPTKYVQEL